LTFGRPSILEEAVESFLRQDYKGEKELVILNDFSEQQIVFDHPQVRILNSNLKFRTIGELKNAIIALCRYDVICPWDDDDVFLPHRISYSIQMMGKKTYFKPSKAFTLIPGPKLAGPNSNLYHTGSIYTREFFNLLHGYSHMAFAEDYDFEVRGEKLSPDKRNYDDIKPEEIYNLYRWDGKSFHLTHFEHPDRYKPTNRVEEYVRSHGFTAGRIEIKPHWPVDYVKLKEDYCKTLKPK
jgi:glycosyltransferase involved in cell wall biosynthesis